MENKPETLKSVLNKFTKSEIIEYYGKGWNIDVKRVKHALLSARWQAKSDEAMKRQNEHSKKLKDIDAKERDRIAVIFNETKDLKEKMRLLKILKGYDNKIQRWYAESKEIDKEQEAVDKIYKELEAVYKERRNEWS